MALSAGATAVHAAQAVVGQTFLGRIYGVSRSFPPNPALPGSGYAIAMNGSVTLTGLGTFRASGVISGNNTEAPPFNSVSTGTMILSNARGSIALQLFGPTLNVTQNNAFTPYAFRVVGGTGVYAGIAPFTGSATLLLHSVRPYGPGTPGYFFGFYPVNGLPGNFAMRLYV